MFIFALSHSALAAPTESCKALFEQPISVNTYNLPSLYLLGLGQKYSEPGFFGRMRQILSYTGNIVTQKIDGDEVLQIDSPLVSKPLILSLHKNLIGNTKLENFYKNTLKLVRFPYELLPEFAIASLIADWSWSQLPVVGMIDAKQGTTKFGPLQKSYTAIQKYDALNVEITFFPAAPYQHLAVFIKAQDTKSKKIIEKNLKTSFDKTRILFPRFQAKMKLVVLNSEIPSYYISLQDSQSQTRQIDVSPTGQVSLISENSFFISNLIELMGQK